MRLGNPEQGPHSDNSEWGRCRLKLRRGAGGLKPPSESDLGHTREGGRNRDSLSINDHWPLPPTPHWHCGIACRAERDRETFKL